MNKGGRPEKVVKATPEELLTLLEAGKSLTWLAKAYGCSRPVMMDRLEAMGIRRIVRWERG